MQLMRAAAMAAVLPVAAIAQPRMSGVPPNPTVSVVRVERVATLEFPWGMAELPDGRILITEKPGRLRILASTRLSPPIEGVPAVAYNGKPTEQGGLLDVAVDPEFEQNRRVYLSYSEEVPQASPRSDTGDPRFGTAVDTSDNRLMGGAVVRATLDGDRLQNLEVIWRQDPKTVGRGHFGHRIVVGRDRTLFITSGERMRFDPAQGLDSNLGKVIRINRDGTIPSDNPFAGQSGARAEVWSLGHRNMLAAAIDPRGGDLWVAEMGPLGGDELNIVERGANYGWPVVSDGLNYDRSPIAAHRTRTEFRAPIRSWTPVISPSGALFYDGSLFPWRGDLIVGGLSSKGLLRLTVSGRAVTAEQRIDLQRRVRDVLQTRDGALLVIVDDRNGELLRLTPAPGR
jgi:glucose/arabinose dehydrogenase